MPDQRANLDSVTKWSGSPTSKISVAEVSRASRPPDRVRFTFDDDNLVAKAGLSRPAALVERHGLEALINTTVCLEDRVGGASLGRKV